MSHKVIRPMRTLLAFLVLTPTLQGAPIPRNKDNPDQMALQGTWTVIAFHLHDGSDVPLDKLGDTRLDIRENGYQMTVDGQAREAKTFALKPGGESKRMEITEKPDGRVLRAIYKLDQDKLTICITENFQAEYPKKFEAKKGYAVIVMQRQPAK
jgi:uncharacterized protein (TIGR03067 family)